MTESFFREWFLPFSYGGHDENVSMITDKTSEKITGPSIYDIKTRVFV